MIGTQSTTKQPHDWWNTLAFGVAALAAIILMIGLSSCSTLPSNAANTRKARPTASNAPAARANSGSVSNAAGGSVPQSLSDAGEYGENIYDMAKASDWQKAEVKLASLRETVKKVHADR